MDAEDPRRQPLARRPAFGIYVHVPFCVAKCRYCDFASRPLAGADPEPYVAALEREIAGAPEAGREVSSVFLGGGTPSLLEARHLARILGALRGAFALAADAEITVEANPGTLTAAKAAAMGAMGVNRVSLGVQSLDDALLARLGRRHDARAALAAFALLREAGCANVSVDLMHGLPGQTPEGWRRDLAQAIELGPEHLSLYALCLEEGTPLFADVRARRTRLPAEAAELGMLAAALELTAAAGYERYEISNFARPGRRCRHNLECWRLGEYRGFGAAAHSFLLAPGPLRLANVADVDDYVRRVRGGESAVAAREEPPPRRFAGEALMLALRTADGVDEGDYARLHGAPPASLFPEAAALGEERGWLERAGGRVRLTSEGMLFSDALFRLLF